MTDPEICTAVWHHYGLVVRTVEHIDRGSAALFKLYGSAARLLQAKAAYADLMAAARTDTVHGAEICRDLQDRLVMIARVSAYTNEYRRYAEVSMDDLRYMPYLYLGQLLGSTYGYKQYLQTGDEELLAFGQWRTEMCRYLMANAGKVSAELVRLS